MMRTGRGRWTAALLGICCLSVLAAVWAVKGELGFGAVSGPDGVDSAAQRPPSVEVTGEGGETGRDESRVEIQTADKKQASPDAEAAAAADETKPAEKVELAGTAQGDRSPAEKQAKASADGQEGQPVQEPSRYDFSQPVPEREAVDKSYFEDAAFIGDSRTDGFMLYSGIGCGSNLTSNGLSIFKLKEKKALTIDGSKYTLLEALGLKQYGKVYLSLGVNELGYSNDEGFYRHYREAIQTIRQLQPNAVVYIQGLIPLNEQVIAQTGGSKYLTNEHLRVYNELMRKAAQEEGVVFLDLYTEFVDETGQLPEGASRDGVHLKSDWCKQWLSYLQTHTVDYDTLYPQGTSVQEPPVGYTEEDIA